MAKRFTDTTKWNDEWFSELNNEEKLAWIYILDTCDHAGIWKKNLRLLNFQIGSSFVEDDLKQVFAGKFIEVKDKWFIPKFIKFQYGNTFLTSNQKAVISARELLIDLGIVQQNDKGTLTLMIELPNPYITLTEELDKSSVTLKDKDRDKEQVKNEEQNKNKNEDRDEEQNKNEDRDKSRDEETDINEKIKRKHQLKEELLVIFKTVPNIEVLIKRNDWDTIERSDKYLFNLHHQKVLEYQAIKI